MIVPALSQKQFDFIAGVIRKLPETYRREVAREFALALAGTNSRFKVQQFLCKSNPTCWATVFPLEWARTEQQR